jgi:hypothetical protein
VRGEVVDEDCAGGAAVVGPRDGAEAFGTCGVPELGSRAVSVRFLFYGLERERYELGVPRETTNLEFYTLSPRAGADSDDLASKFHADCLRTQRPPFVLYEAV